MSSTDTSSCYHHPVISTDSVTVTHQHAITIRRRLTHARPCNFWGQAKISEGRTFQNAFSKHCSTILGQNKVLTSLKSASKTHSEFYPSQTKILEGWTKDDFWIFDWFSRVRSPKSSTHALEKCFENPDVIFCSSFQNLRLGSIKFWKDCSLFQTIWAVQHATTICILKRAWLQHCHSCQTSHIS